MEKLIYESRPYAFLAIAMGAILASNGSKLMFGSGLLLLALSGFIITARMKYRGVA